MVMVPQILPGRRLPLELRVETWKTPTLEIHILASCAEGKFSRITPIQWKSIGWAPVETMK